MHKARDEGGIKYYVHTCDADGSDNRQKSVAVDLRLCRGSRREVSLSHAALETNAPEMVARLGHDPPPPRGVVLRAKVDGAKLTL